MDNSNEIPDFPYRINPDGSYASICILCLATIATAKDLAALHARHMDHACQPFVWTNGYLPNHPS